MNSDFSRSGWLIYYLTGDSPLFAELCRSSNNTKIRKVTNLFDNRSMKRKIRLMQVTVRLVRFCGRELVDIRCPVIHACPISDSVHIAVPIENDISILLRLIVRRLIRIRLERRMRRMTDTVGFRSGRVFLRFRFVLNHWNRGCCQICNREGIGWEGKHAMSRSARATVKYQGYFKVVNKSWHSNVVESVRMRSKTQALTVFSHSNSNTLLVSATPARVAFVWNKRAIITVSGISEEKPISRTIAKYTTVRIVNMKKTY